jgi:hypothetical protein
MSFTDEVEPKFASWGELVANLAVGQFQGWIFRGLPSYDYSPISSLERVLRTAGMDPTTWPERENLSIGFFKDRARHYLTQLPADDDLLGWLSLMQHYGAPTRLVDWTVSPFVACYFAYDRPAQNTASAALWMLNARACRQVFGSQFPFGCDHMGVVSSTTHDKDGVEVERSYPGREITLDDVAREENQLVREVIEHEAAWPLPLSILRPDRRMAAQQACVVCSGKLGGESSAVELLMQETTHEKIAERLKDVTPQNRYLSTGNIVLRLRKDGGSETKAIFEIPAFVVKKIELPFAWRNEALASLARMNITADALFPGLDGVGRATEVYAQTGAPPSMREYLDL